MNKRLILFLALAFVVGISVAAYAEVQNVKVSGDIAVMGVSRNNLDLGKEPVGTVTRISNASNWADQESDMLSIARVRVDADLTDNVTTTIRLLNERNWNGESRATNNSTQANTNISYSPVENTVASESDLALDLAYVTLKEFLYSPLSLTVGRQLLRFGNGFVVGDPDTNIYSAATALAEGDLSSRKSFDAVRLTLDYSPLVVDGVYAKIEEQRTNLNDDVTLYGLNTAYDLNKDTTLEGYFFSKVKGSDADAVYNIEAGNRTRFDGTSNIKQKADKVNTVGLRVANKSVKNLTLDAQGAFQFGTYNPKFDPNARYTNPAPDRKAKTSPRRAFAAQVEATYDLKDIAQIAKYSPVITANYSYFSGARDKIFDTTYRGWDPMFEDQTYGHLMNAILANTNMHRAFLSGKAKLTDDIGLKLDYAMAWFAQRYHDGRVLVLSGISSTSANNAANQFRIGNQHYLGQEIDATLTYDYTEDVQFSLLGGVFLPGRSINTGRGDLATDGGRWPKRAAATELIGSMKVTF